jgi:hypothetical protein
MSTATVVINPFIANRVPPALMKLFTQPATANVDIKHTDDVYYAIRAFTDLSNDPLKPAGFDDPTKPITATMYAFTPDRAAADWPSMQMELTFLVTLGFAFERENTYYIHPLAEVLYGTTGYFSDPTQTAAASDLMKVMLHYVLPGLYWRLHYAREELPNTITLTHHLDTTLRDIASLAIGSDDAIKDAATQ